MRHFWIGLAVFFVSGTGTGLANEPDSAPDENLLPTLEVAAGKEVAVTLGPATAISVGLESEYHPAEGNDRTRQLYVRHQAEQDVQPLVQIIEYGRRHDTPVDIVRFAAVDFNFDGWLDIGVDIPPTDHRGNNETKIFLYHPASKRFVPGPKLYISGGIAYCQIRDKEQSLAAGHNGSSGESSVTVHRYRDGQLHETWKINDSISADFSEVAVSKPDGTVIKKGLFDVDHNPTELRLRPAIRVIPVDKAWLYSSAEATTKTEMYLVRGDRIELLDLGEDYLNSRWNGWAHVRYEGKRTIEAWIKVPPEWTGAEEPGPAGSPWTPPEKQP